MTIAPLSRSDPGARVDQEPNGPALLVLRGDQAGDPPGDGSRWLGPADDEDEALLDRAKAPVLDVGCGPGRHLLALRRRGLSALGLDITPSAVRLARRRGASVVEGSIYGPVPRPGTWASALLLDGNIGIGADPAALLSRIAEVLCPGGTILIELAAPGTGGGAGRARLDHDGRLGPWFEWATVSASDISTIAAAAAMTVVEVWSRSDRWFAELNADQPGGGRRAEETPADAVGGPRPAVGGRTRSQRKPGPPVATLVGASDVELARLLCERVPAALEEVFRRHGGLVARTVARVGGASYVDDIAQEVFLALWRSPGRFQPDRGSLGAYLVRATRCRAIDALRSDGARHRRHRELGERAGTDPQSCLEDEVVDECSAKELRATLGRLPANECIPIEMAYFGGYTYREVARMLGQPEGTIKYRIRTGLGRLAGRLPALTPVKTSAEPAGRQ